MNSKNIDALNVVLIAVSLVLAFKLPFELFLFSYAILGPLHYLTEINWLNKKNYFVKQPMGKWIWLFVLFAALISLPQVFQLPALAKLAQTPNIKSYLKYTDSLPNQLVLVSLLFAIGLVYLKNNLQVILFLVAAAILSVVILKYVSFSVLLVGLFIPTIIHVYLFTLLFMIFGTLASKSAAGVTAIIFLILCPAIIAISSIDPETYSLTESTQHTFAASGFNTVNGTIQHVLGIKDSEAFLLSGIGIKTQIFIAFCYTYHYLNWFSKTSIIGWGKNISKPKLVLIVIIWLAAIALYWYDYKTGFIALLFLSFFHVLIEFPLNITTIKAIAGKLGNKREPVPVPVQNSDPGIKKKKGKQ